MSLAELYTKEARVWIPDPELVWRGAILKEDYTGQKKLAIEYDEEGESDLPPLRNPEILIGENDLTSLSYLHEPAVLYNLQVRFCDRNDIYTYCGIVLVAINPYESLPIYDNDTIQAYSGQDMATMDPHIFAVAEEAFKRMSRFEENQSIIVSGESGAGKTVSAKYAMRYFATVCGAEGETEVEKRVLASNPVMEAIGNAKTTRNDNSSRFGKYIEIGFSKGDSIIGANMRTYLLEKSRVVFQASEERNYHIFYQLCAVCDTPQYQFLKLNHPSVFYYTNQGEDPVIDGVDDAEDFVSTVDAFSLLGINEARQREIFRIISGILHMGNVVFQEEDDESCILPKTDKHLPIMAEMFGIDQEQIRNWLCKRKIVTVNETLSKPLNITQAYNSRDALAKSIYSRLFNWIVYELNKSLSTGIKVQKFIGVLDIYGFETFEINSFEQFCINYANEKLQQQFCLHVFKLEQEEYVKEQIEWSFIDFYDNQPCIDLIEGKLGLLDLLDEECRMPKGSDKNWCQKLYDKHSQKKHFEKPRMSQTAFIILHFADNVQYQIDGFLEKNRDEVLEEHVNILKASQYELVAELFQEPKAAEPKGPTKRPPAGRGGVIRSAKESSSRSAGSKNRQTVGSQFRDSLNKLMETLFSTTPHYVRCIKPNDFKMSFTFEPKRAIQQLRACGVLETIRISAAGYPSRWTYPEFFQRYRVLAHSKEIQRKNMRKTCENIITKLIEDRDKYQFGKTKIFFRAGQVAYLEKLRSDRLKYCGILIQKRIRGWLAKTRYQKIRRTALLVQTYARGYLARKKALYLRRTHAAIVIQSKWRSYFCRQRYLKALKSVVFIQAYARALFGRQKFNQIRAERKAIVLQKAIRGWLERKRYKTVIHGITRLQAHVRRRAAKKLFKQLKIEARSVEHIKKVAKGLENKIIELQQKLDEKAKENTLLREDQVNVNELKNEVNKLHVVEKNAKLSHGKISDLEELVKKLRAELEKEKAARETTYAVCFAGFSLGVFFITYFQIIETLQVEKLWLKEELEKANQRVKEQEQRQEVIVQKKLEEAKRNMMREFDSERAHHQKLVKDYGRLQQRLENLQGEMATLSPTAIGHQRTASGISNISLESECSTVTERSDVTGVPMADIGLVSRLQNRVKELERNNAQLRREQDRREGGEAGGSGDPERDIYETIKLQELEMEGSKMKEELNLLRKAIADSTDFEGTGLKGGAPAKEFMDQFEAMADELARRREECIQLRTLLASRSRTTDALASENYGGDPNLVNEDGELEMAYRTQKDLNKLLENELQRVQKCSEVKEKELRIQLDELKKDSNRQQKLISQNLTMTPEARIEATMQHEITRLTSENLDLRDVIERQTEQIKKLKKALKIYAKRLKSTEASDVQAELEREMAADENVPAVKHVQQREYTGMFEYRKEDEPLLVRNLIIDLKPRLAAQQLPGLPAYILFMSIRHTDYLNDDEKVRTLLTGTINSIKKVVKKRQDDVETITMWLANTCRLLHNLKQYSGEKTFQNDNSQKQNEHCLRNFDLSEYRQILSDLAVWIYQGLLKLMESQIQPMIVGAVLEHEAIAGLSGSKPTGLRGRQLSNSREFDDKQKDFSLDSLMKALDNFIRVLDVHAVDPELVKQVFRQLFYFICSNALNNLLLRKDMCHWSKGMQMRYNLSHLEQWLRDHKLQETPCQDALDPIIQASQLLQARKTEADVESICEMCSRLSTSQIIKILNLYTPVNEFEERVPISFIRKIQEHLSSRQDTTQSLLMDTKFFYAVTFPFNPSNLGLESIVAPPEWGLGFLKRL
ncbi:hypothetical protein CAPTEDRAFT_225225 [Capitella teleta]|uniref:Myosin motor domain-containing protein n=1 Tax=Capitella teleta TaxID=283909 RepID=R7T565_CAPTE|nr:hypothetical protein CAPTEDRAFT_225225 [Capitella teleta]|eukprot:ELT88116.1 hypothetical protein CAPTEDRAFT_225225 [Capitella teleta]